MNWLSYLESPQVVAPTFGLLGVLLGAGVSSWTTRASHKERLQSERELAERRIVADIALAERRFGYECDLAERKFAYDREFNDHKRRVELAEEVLTSFFKMRDIMREVRSPAGFENEGEDRPAWEGETDQQAKARRGFFVPASRLAKHGDFINNLMTKRYQMNAYFGPEAEVPFNMIWDVLAQVQSAVRMMMRSINTQGHRQGDAALWKRWESAIWSDSEDPDPHSAAVEKAIGRMEAICRPVLSGPEA